MSIQQFPGGIITQNPTAPTGPYQDSAAPGIWTLDEVTNFIKQGIWPTAGNTNPNAFIENLFSTYLYTGTGSGSAQTITNGIDLAGEGGLVWIKDRTVGYSHSLFDTARGVTLRLLTNGTGEEILYPTSLTAFNSNGFTIGDFSNVNSDGSKLVSWTFRKQPKFFDVVTYTGTGSARTVAHSLGSVPGCIIVKSSTYALGWPVYHRSNGTGTEQYLNTTDAVSYGDKFPAAPTSTNFTVSGNGYVNEPGETYVAYLFAHDAGGFGLAGTDNVVSCGSYTGNGSTNGPDVTLGYQPQWVMIKNASSTGAWLMLDTMRGFIVGDGYTGVAGSADARLYANLSSAEDSGYNRVDPTSTGFKLTDNSSEINTNGATYIYIAIRRGPMAVPTLGTTVYNAITRTGTGAIAQVTGVGFPPDLVASGFRNYGGPPTFFDKLRAPLRYISSSTTDAEATRAGTLTSFNQDGFSLGADAFNLINFNTGTFVDWNFRRAPGFFDEVCYTGTGANRTVAHNLAAVPELMIVKNRVEAGGERWTVYSSFLTATKAMYLDGTNAGTTASVFWNNTEPTASVFSVGTAGNTNTNTQTYVAYLFATCPGVSKVGSYTGTGTTLAINCGFTTGARFVLIKRTDSTGDWYVWDSARGIIAGNDPYLLLNSTAVEVTNTDYVDAAASGFEITSTAPAAINASGGSYIFLAIS